MFNITYKNKQQQQHFFFTEFIPAWCVLNKLLLQSKDRLLVVTGLWRFGTQIGRDAV